MDYDMQEMNNGGIEINVFAFLKVVAKKIWIVVALAIVFSAVSAGYSYFTKVNTYTTKFSFVVNTITDETEMANSSEINASINIASTYKYILQGRTVCKETAKKCTIPVTASEVASSMTIKKLSGSSIMEVRIKTDSPEKSYAIAKSLAENYNDVVSKIYSNANLNVCDYPEMSKTPDASKKSVVNGSVGAATGAVIGFIIIIIYYFVKNTVRNVEDIYRKLGINVLGTVNKVETKAKGLLITNKKIGFAYIETFKAIRTKITNRYQ